MDETNMKLTLEDGEVKEIHCGAALTGYAATDIEIEWRELDSILEHNTAVYAMAYLNKAVRCRLLPGAELRIVQNYGPENK